MTFYSINHQKLKEYTMNYVNYPNLTIKILVMNTLIV
jgi:hypothetical protein